MKLFSTIAISLALVTFNVSAQKDFDQLASTALAKIDNMNREQWTFTQTDTNIRSGEIDVSTFDPGRAVNEQWQLISKSGKEPTAKQIKKFNNRMNLKEEDDVEVHEVSLSDMVKKASVTFVSQQGDFAHYSFTPIIDDLADEQEKLSGELIVAIAKQQISAMIVTNTEELSPAFSVTLKQFKLSFDFSDVETRPVLTKATTSISGTVGFFKDLDQDSTQEFSNYDFVGG